MTEPTYSDRRNATSPEQFITLESGRISVSMDGKLKRAIAIDEIAEVRLGVEMAGRDSQVVCRITANDGTQIVFGSRSWKSVGLWENRADRFLEFNTALHRALLPHAASIRFIEGQPLWFGFVMCGLGILMALLGGGFALYLLWDDNLIGFGGVPGLIIGLYLAWMFRPRAPKPYNPALYAGSG